MSIRLELPLLLSFSLSLFLFFILFYFLLIRLFLPVSQSSGCTGGGGTMAGVIACSWYISRCSRVPPFPVRS
ncbi:hypothetical protein BJX70DRAFT_370617 [Aspergillus crustosus]